MRYAIVIHKDYDSSYGVTVPDLPGCFSGGDTLDEAFDMAREAIVGHVETLILDGQPIPPLRPLEEHQDNEDYRDGVWGFVDVDTDISKLSDRAERINITSPSRVLAVVDNAATRAGISRSELLARAAMQYVEQDADRRRYREEIASLEITEEEVADRLGIPVYFLHEYLWRDMQLGRFHTNRLAELIGDLHSESQDSAKPVRND